MNCKGLFGRLFGHDYSARFSTTPPAKATLNSGSAQGVVMVVEAMTAKRYEGDVCRRCGHTVNQQKAEA